MSCEEPLCIPAAFVVLLCLPESDVYVYDLCACSVGSGQFKAECRAFFVYLFMLLLPFLTNVEQSLILKVWHFCIPESDVYLIYEPAPLALDNSRLSVGHFLYTYLCSSKRLFGLM